MGLAIAAFLLSAAAGLCLNFVYPGFGTFASVSIIGAFIIYSLNRKK